MKFLHFSSIFVGVFFYKRVIFGFFFLCTVFNTASSVAPQIPLCAGIVFARLVPGPGPADQNGCLYMRIRIQNSDYMLPDQLLKAY
jgi:hypothetical protein